MDSLEKICFKWNDFRNIVSSSFQNMQNNTDFTDITLVSEGNQKIMFHKFVLASSSSIFCNILKESYHSHPLIYLHGIKGGIVCDIIEFM